jgi:hypothetical protein
VVNGISSYPLPLLTVCIHSYFDSFVVPDGHLIPDPLYGILRLATKYCVPKIRRKGLDILRKPFTVSLEEHDLVSSLYWTRATFGNLANVILLAQQIQVLDILPFAFYMFSAINPDTKLLRASTLLSYEDQARCLAGRVTILEMQKLHTASFAFDFTASPRCLRRNVCQLQQPSPEIWRLFKAGTFHRVQALYRFPLKENNMLQVCPECNVEAVRRHEEGRKYVWDQLPAIFNLGTWEELLKARNEEM